MKLRTKYILFVVIVHIAALVLSYFVFKNYPFLFIACEAIIIVSIVIAWNLYKQLIQPLKMLADGTEAIKDRDFSVKFLTTGKYEMDELINVYNQMIDQLRTERTKQEEQHFFLEKLIQTSPTGIIILDYEDNIQQINPKAMELLNAEEKEIKNKPVHEISNAIIQQVAQLKSGESKTVTLNGASTYKIQKSHFIDRGFPRHFVMIEELTAEILAAEKKAYGKVIRMMAHEVNNTIGPVNSILQSALKKEDLWKENENLLLQHAIKIAVDRNQNLNIFMRNFADVVRLPEPNRKQLNLHDLIHAVAKLMEIKGQEKQVEFQYAFAQDEFYVFADEQQMEQVLINITKNAIEAIGEKGTIIFRTDISTRQLTVVDSGKGIEDKVAEQLFSPFFSTKKDGQGIGLTIVREILLNHGFEFYLKSFSEKRTEFVIKF
ncbi:MAG TPA: ATP-binding protein [Parafilimonas sp.]|nr:ATP-binding protein [Parafilimonas sp.]